MTFIIPALCVMFVVWLLGVLTAASVAFLLARRSARRDQNRAREDLEWQIAVLQHELLARTEQRPTAPGETTEQPPVSDPVPVEDYIPERTPPAEVDWDPTRDFNLAPETDSEEETLLPEVALCEEDEEQPEDAAPKTEWDPARDFRLEPEIDPETGEEIILDYDSDSVPTNEADTDAVGEPLLGFDLEPELDLETGEEVIPGYGAEAKAGEIPDAIWDSVEVPVPGQEPKSEPEPLVDPEEPIIPEPAAPEVHAPVASPAIAESEIPSPRESLEMKIGRRLFAWTAVALFLIGLVFFVQVAAANGWVRPLGRCLGLAATSCVFLISGWKTHKKGLGNWSASLTSAGVAGLFAACAYAERVGLASASFMLPAMVGTVFFAFLLSGLYRSLAVGYATAAIGITTLVFMVGDRWEYPYVCVFWLCCWVASLLLANRLKRGSTAALPWLGTFFLTELVPFRNAEGSRTLCAALALFLIIDAFELLRLFFTRSRIAGATDFFRACATPWFVFATVCHVFYERETFDFSSSAYYCRARLPFSDLRLEEFFPTHGAVIAVLYCAFVLLAILVWNRRRSEFERVSNAEGVMKFESALTLRAVLATGAFATAVFGLAFASGRNGYSAACAVQAVGLLAAAGGALLARRTSPEVAFSGEDSGARLLRRRRLGSSLTLVLFALFALLFWWNDVSIMDLRVFDDAYWPLEEFLDVDNFVWKGVLPVFNQTAFQPLLTAFVAIFGVLVFRRGSERRDAGLAGEAISCATKLAGLCLAAPGSILLLSGLCSQIYTASAARAYLAGMSSPGLVGCCVFLLFWLAAACVAGLAGRVFRAPNLSRAGAVVALLLAVKLLAANALQHPVEGGLQVPPLLSYPVGWSSVAREVFNSLPDPLGTPLVNAFSLPFTASGAVLLLWGASILLGKRREGAASSRLVDGQLLSLAGAALLIVIGSLDLFGWFHFRPTRYDAYDFYARHALWLFLLAVGTGTLLLSRFRRMRGVAPYALTLLIGATPGVFTGEFGSGDWRVCYHRVAELFNPWMVPALAFFVIEFVVGLCYRFGARRADAVEVETTSERTTRALGGLVGALGLAGLVLLATFETFRYIADRPWFSSVEWTKSVSSAVLWTVAVFLSLLLSRALRSRYAAWVGFAFWVALASRFLAIDLVRESCFTIPLLNPRGAVVLLTFASTAAIACHAQLFTNRNPRSLRAILTTAALLLLLVGCTRDVYECTRLFPAGDRVDTVFMAQTAVTALWTLFAALLLASGFHWKNAALRWSAIILFAATTIKVLTVDLSFLNSMYRVVAFLVLAFALMAAAWGYNRRK